jgi:hypothetical protein
MLIDECFSKFVYAIDFSNWPTGIHEVKALPPVNTLAKP